MFDEIEKGQETADKHTTLLGTEKCTMNTY